MHINAGEERALFLPAKSLCLLLRKLSRQWKEESILTEPGGQQAPHWGHQTVCMGRERIQWRVGLEQGAEWPDGSLATPARERRRKNLAGTKRYTTTKPRMQMRVNSSKFNFPPFNLWNKVYPPRCRRTLHVLLLCTQTLNTQRHSCSRATCADWIHTRWHTFMHQQGHTPSIPQRADLCCTCATQSASELQTNYTTQRNTVAHLSHEKWADWPRVSTLRPT